MKYIEYIYLGAALVLVVIMAQSWSDFSLINKLILVGAIAVVAFMFSFRRNQRIAREKAEEEHYRRLEEESRADDEEE